MNGLFWLFQRPENACYVYGLVSADQAMPFKAW
jgi:hypothetical protein